MDAELQRKLIPAWATPLVSEPTAFGTLLGMLGALRLRLKSQRNELVAETWACKKRAARKMCHVCNHI